MADTVKPQHEPLLIVGSGGHAKVVIELFRAQGRFSIVGCTDPSPLSPDVLGIPVLGGDDQAARLFAEGVRHAFVAIGDNALRLRLGRRLSELGFGMPTVIHPAATVSPTAIVGSGVAIMAGAVVNAQALIGDFAILNTLSSIDHDCVLGDSVHVAPRATLAGCVQLGEGVLFGVGAVAIPHVRVGPHTTIGAGAVVIRDLPGDITAVGVPARSFGKR